MGGTSDAVVVVVPVLRRPHRIAPLMESVAAATPEEHRLLFVATATDSLVVEELERLSADFLTMRPAPRGDYARKVNEGIRQSVEPFVFLGADDLAFRPGWYPAALALMADPTIGVVGTQDLGSPRVLAGTHSTHSLLRRSYVLEFGTIDERGKALHEGYWHEFVDDELVETARKRGAFAFAHGSVVEHLHPSWGKAQPDALYEQQARRMAQGRQLYNRRRRLWK